MFVAMLDVLLLSKSTWLFCAKQFALIINAKKKV
jgi:hypothetical protein